MPLSDRQAREAFEQGTPVYTRNTGSDQMAWYIHSLGDLNNPFSRNAYIRSEPIGDPSTALGGHTAKLKNLHVHPPPQVGMRMKCVRMKTYRAGNEEWYGYYNQFVIPYQRMEQWVGPEQEIAWRVIVLMDPAEASRRTGLTVETLSRRTGGDGFIGTTNPQALAVLDRYNLNRSNTVLAIMRESWMVPAPANTTRRGEHIDTEREFGS